MNLDAYIIEWINGNWLFLTMLIGLLKVIAKMTPSVYDDQIVTMLAGAVGLVKKPPVGVPPLKDRGEELQ